MPEYLFPLEKTEGKIMFTSEDLEGKSDEDKARACLSEIIEVLRNHQIDMDTPYDFDNFISDYCSHSQLFKTGMFQSGEE